MKTLEAEEGCDRVCDALSGDDTHAAGDLVRVGENAESWSADRVVVYESVLSTAISRLPRGLV